MTVVPKNVLHSKATPRWGTPADIIERARRVMGGIDLDPCSETKFNAIVKAKQFYSLEERKEDGLALPWHGKVLLNPPGGLVREFWEKMLSEDIDQCVYIGFSLEQLALLADCHVHPAELSICYLRKRIRFTRHDGFSGSPSHGNFVCGINVDHARFDKEFGSLGKVIAGPQAGRLE